MHGLILKDWILLKKSIIILAIAVVCCTVVTILLKLGVVAYLIAFAFAVMLPVSIMTVDTASRWERYALALPLSRREILAKRYQFTLLCFGAAAVFCIAATLCAEIFLPQGADFFGISGLVWCTGIMGAALLLHDLIFAVYYRYRVNLGAVAIIVIVVVPNMLVYFPDLLKPEILRVAALVLATAGAAGLWISWRISAAAYGRWDAP